MVHNKYLVIENTTKMAYVECKIWPFSNKIRHQEARWKAMKEGMRLKPF